MTKVHGSCDLGEGWATKAMSDEGDGGDGASHNYGEADGKHKLNNKLKLNKK